MGAIMNIVRPSLVALALFVTLSCGGKGPNPAQPTTPSLASFTGGTWTLQVNRAWDGTTGAPQFPLSGALSDYMLDESGYKAAPAATYAVTLSDSGGQVTVSGTVMGTFQGQRGKVADSFVQYDLKPGTALASARLIVWQRSEGLEAELTIYGSGVPIIKSERGLLVAAQ